MNRTHAEIAEHLGVTQSTVSRLVKRFEHAERRGRELNATDFVEAAYAGEISHDELIQLLQNYTYVPRYRTTGLADDYEGRPNSTEAIYDAYFLDLITNDECGQLLDTVTVIPASE